MVADELAKNGLLLSADCAKESLNSLRFELLGSYDDRENEEWDGNVGCRVAKAL